jgi:type IV pilus assembly protein PilW
MSRFFRKGLTSSPRGGAGFSLIELMVALVLGLLVAGAAFAIFHANQLSYRSNEGLNRVQESARVAFELMSRDIRAAGGSACSNVARPNVEHANSAEEVAFLTAPLSSVSPQTELTTVSGDDTAYRITASTTSSLTLDAAQIADATTAFNVNDQLVLCNANQLYIVRATSVTPTTVAFTPATTVALTADPLAPAATVMLARYRNTRWFAADNSLFVSRAGGAREEVAQGVQNLAVSYLETGGNTYNPVPANWANIVAVRVNMTLVGQDGEGRAISRNVSNVVSLRSRTP